MHSLGRQFARYGLRAGNEEAFDILRATVSLPAVPVTYLTENEPTQSHYDYRMKYDDESVHFCTESTLCRRLGSVVVRA